ncbi:malonate decarboxylase subunit epsilon [Dechloromonas sp. XY25]|uniref:Malonate decarboxylase subunit epsilon n=1 Tax=Dechloromonas hankyongensis TaxID=2908002 RepID=A0ABS9JXI2_9RHOO|nr:malonate decarboxylase subunit epsilon [Dechloromonas hankyongensis]MCG2575620.1 malonate decarboxylase subunit epsilon [Dechloromonas hankyongensis]
MRLALLFSGQGGQTPAHWQQVREGADGELGAALARVLPAFADPLSAPAPEQLATNRIAQPLIFAQQMLLWGRLQSSLPKPICAAGYSLGEMAACSAAGAFGAAEGVALCAERAAAMDGAAPGEHGMLAVLGLDDELVSTLAAENRLAVAIRNAPRHLVVAGPRAGIAAVVPRYEAAGASRLVHLAVRTPSHTALLTGAVAAFKQRLDVLSDRRLAFPVFSAIDASAARMARPALDALARQICTPLDWAACLQAVREMQPDAVLEIGPGNALARLFGELAPEIPVRACDDFRSPDGIVRWLTADS